MRSEGTDLRRSRVAAGLSRQDVADISGLSRNEVTAVERDHPRSRAHVQAVRAALDWDVRARPFRKLTPVPPPKGPSPEIPMGLSPWAKDYLLAAQGVIVACGSILVGLAAVGHPAAFAVAGVEYAVLVPALTIVGLWLLRRPHMLLPNMVAMTWSCTVGTAFLYETSHLVAGPQVVVVSALIQAYAVAASATGLGAVMFGVRNRFSPILS